jgi:hypothetical protein
MFKKRKKKLLEPKERGLYAFTKHRRGDFILFLEKNGEDVFKFMQLPDRYPLSLSQEEFTEGVLSTILDFVEQIPQDVFEVSKANINNLEKTLDVPVRK